MGYVTGILTFTPFEDWKRSHNVHHATAGDLDPLLADAQRPALTVDHVGVPVHLLQDEVGDIAEVEVPTVELYTPEVLEHYQRRYPQLQVLRRWPAAGP